MGAEIRETLERYFRLVNEEKFDELFELFDPDVEFVGPFNFKARGVENVKPFYLRIPVDYSEHVDTPEEILVSGNRAAVFIDFKGRRRSGIGVSLKAADWFRFEEGKIRSLNIFLDSHHLGKVITGKIPS